MRSTNWNQRQITQGICQGGKERKYLEVWVNGHVEFWTPLDEEFAWKQPHEEFKVNPLLYPYPVTEYLATFLRLYRDLVDICKIVGGHVIDMEYSSINGYILKPYAPGVIDYMFAIGTQQFEGNDINYRQIVDDKFIPDLLAFDLLKHVYRSFGLESRPSLSLTGRQATSIGILNERARWMPRT